MTIMKNQNNNDQGKILLYLGLIVVFALCPPIGVAIVLCIVLSDGTVEGFIGCLTPIIILIVIAFFVTLFD